MTSPQSLALTRLDRSLLHFGQRLVPAADRHEWLRAWQAELWYRHSRSSRSGHRRSLTIGLLRDALCLRSESWRCAFSGTALLCLTLLATLVGLAALPAFVYAGSSHQFAQLLLHQLPRFAVASGLVLFVSSASSFTTVDRFAARSVLRWCRAQAFFLAKLTLLLLLTFLISTDLCLPLEARALFAAMPLQLLLFVILALFALRWNLLDGQSRCKHCLRSLAAPARVGRPSWNFLEYNGTELACRDGHGLLTVPEIETSWCRSSAWIPQQGS